jgi:hypothetical protein
LLNNFNLVFFSKNGLNASIHENFSFFTNTKLLFF